MNPLHIVFFNRAFPPEVSATSQLLAELAEGLAHEYGYRVTVVAGMPMGPRDGRWTPPPPLRLIQREQIGKVELLRVRNSAFPKEILWGRFTNYLTYFALSFCAASRLARPDIAVALTDPPIIGLTAWWIARRHRCCWVVSFRDLFPEAARLLSHFRSLAIEAALNRITRFLIQRADVLVALGESMREKLILEKGAAPHRVRVIPDWVDCSSVVPGPKENPFAQAHALTDRFVVMHAGNMGNSQNLEILLEAAALLRDLPNLQFILMGDGVRRAALEALATARGLSHVRFIPFQPKEKLAEAFAAADCFVVSLKPGLAGTIVPSKLYGILAAGRPFVAAVEDSCEAARIAREHHCGLTAQPGNPHDLAAKIQSLYHDSTLASRLGENARRISWRFDRRAGIHAYHSLFRELCPEAVLR